MQDCKADGMCLCDLKGAIGNQCERLLILLSVNIL